MMNLIGLARWRHAAEHKAALLALVEARMAAQPGTSLGVASPASWSSDKRLFDDPVTAPLVAWITGELTRRVAQPVVDLSGWANVLAAGQTIGPHAHVQSHLGGVNRYAGVYYVQAAGPGGVLIVHGEGTRRLDVVPVEGQVVLFTADTLHEVTAHESELPRVSIAFNVRVEEAT